MKKRRLGKTNFEVSEVSLGTWQVGGKWGADFDFSLAGSILEAAIDGGVNFIDTADVYGDGLSEEAVGRAVRARSQRIYVATKCGRRLQPHLASGYNGDNITRFVEDSLRRLGLDVIDLVQLHCPPPEVLSGEAAFDVLDELKAAGKIRHYGVSVETVDEAKTAIGRRDVASIQIIFNMMRLKPAEEVFGLAQQHDVGIIARVPLASGLLSGRFAPDTRFEPGDHRHFNRKGEVFDRGETFSGVDYEWGLSIVEQHYVPLLGRRALAAKALRWILMFDAVSTVIPGASSADQVVSNLQAATLPAFSRQEMESIRGTYEQFLRADIHPHW